MKPLSILLVVILACVSFSPAAIPADPKDEIPLKDLPPFSFKVDGYRVDPYLEAAGKLRAAGKEKAVKLLQAAVKDHEVDATGVIILCRMLFTAKPKGKFRPPRLGLPVALGGADWPLQPIEIVEGVPFLIVQGYNIAGQPESPEVYLDYCLKKCDWGTAEFKPRTAEEKKQALKNLLSSKKWKEPPADGERSFLAAQIK